MQLRRYQVEKVRSLATRWIYAFHKQHRFRSSEASSHTICFIFSLYNRQLSQYIFFFCEQVKEKRKPFSTIYRFAVAVDEQRDDIFWCMRSRAYPIITIARVKQNDNNNKKQTITKMKK